MTVLTTNARDAPARHRTLRTALEWSYDLLEPDERALFRRLSVFVGPWTLEAARRVCGEPTQTSWTPSARCSTEPAATPFPPGRTSPSSSSSKACASTPPSCWPTTKTGRGPGTGTPPTSPRRRARDGGRHRAPRRVRVVERRHGVGRGQPALRVGAQPRPSDTRRRRCALAAALGWHSFFRGHLGTGRARLRRTLEAAILARSHRPTMPSPRRWASRPGSWRGRSATSSAAHGHLQPPGLVISQDGGDLRRTAVASSFPGHIARTEGRFADAGAAHREGRRALPRGVRAVSGVRVDALRPRPPRAPAWGRPRGRGPRSCVTGSRISAGSTTAGRSAGARGRWRPSAPARPRARRGGERGAGGGPRPAPGGRRRPRAGAVPGDRGQHAGRPWRRTRRRGCSAPRPSTVGGSPRRSPTTTATTTTPPRWPCGPRPARARPTGRGMLAEHCGCPRAPRWPAARRGAGSGRPFPAHPAEPTAHRPGAPGRRPGGPRPHQPADRAGTRHLGEDR